MRRLWTHRDIDAPAPLVWQLLCDLERWPDCGPSVRSATLDGKALSLGATGRVTTAVGVDLSFTITEFEANTAWAWKVAGLPATAHSVESLGADRCRARFGVPLAVAPYLAICALALRRIDELATVDPSAPERGQTAGPDTLENQAT